MWIRSNLASILSLATNLSLVPVLQQRFAEVGIVQDIPPSTFDRLTSLAITATAPGHQVIMNTVFLRHLYFQPFKDMFTAPKDFKYLS